MKFGRDTLLVLGVVLSTAVSAVAVVPRQDIIWARKAVGPITLNGILNEPEWAAAETMTINWGVDNGIPGSGWKVESGRPVPSDPTRATLKFLVVGNQLYLGASIPDSSVGGSVNFNRFDGILMAIKDRTDPGLPKPPAEYFYSWWKDVLPGPPPPDPQPVGDPPNFRGKWGSNPALSPRDSTQIANWDAVTVVNGLSNSDATIDVGYTVEMRFNLTPMGYDVTQPGGDVVEWNIAIYDTDWFWPFLASKFYCNRVWWQGPWGNNALYNEVRIHTRPSVTTTSGALPIIAHDIAIPEVSQAAPVIDGNLADAAWANPLVYDFDIRWNDAALIASYPATGKYRSGQYQPPVNNVTAFVADPANATVKMLVKGNDLYLSFDVDDQIVQYHPSIDRWDGFIFSINDRVVRGPDNQLKSWRLSFQVAQNGTGLAQDDLPAFITSGDAQLALALKPGTTVDTLGASADQGYTAELKIDLTAIGYPAGLGDRLAFLGVDLLDGDSFLPVTLSYGQRTWWFREYEGQCCPAYAYLAPLSAVGAEAFVGRPVEEASLTAFPNPSVQATLEYAIPEESRVAMDVYDIAGRLVEHRDMGIQAAGIWRTSLDAGDRTPGVYFVRMTLIDPSSGSTTSSIQTKTVLLR